MKLLPKYLIIFLCISIPLIAPSQNICLDYDGFADYLQTNIPLANSDFTIEMWFKSEDPSLDPDHCDVLFDFGLTNYNYVIAICGGVFVFYDGINPAVNLTSSTFNDSQWHYLEFIKNGNSASLYVDCIAEATGIVLSPQATPDIQSLYLGTYAGLDNISWDGKIDECKVFNYAKSVADICAYQYCPMSGLEPGLLLYYNFDEGTAYGNNTGIGSVPDLSTPAYPANFSSVSQGFALTGNASNYIPSTAPVIYPLAYNYNVELKDYLTQSTNVNIICDGDPIHFGLYDNGTLLDNATLGLDIVWEYKDPGSPWTSLPAIPYSKFSFGVPANFITTNCSSNNDGFTDRIYRAKVDVTDPTTGTVCNQTTSEAPLRICCPISPFNVTISPTTIVCDGDPLNHQVCINSTDPFVNTPGPLVDIKWFINNVYDPSFDDMTCFNYTGIADRASGLCFEARISNCNNKLTSANKCLIISKKPVCGQIDIWPSTAIYPFLVSPGIYEICPGDDTQLGIVLPSGFSDCIPNWQYSFNNSGPWISLGSSNTVQNTNIIPTSLWPSNNIYYRIQCNPISGICPPCESNIIEIRIMDPPINSNINGPTPVCKGSTNTLTVNTPQPSHNYNWFCNGAFVGTGINYSYTADKSACYQLEISNACYTILSTTHCVEVCEIGAILSCPKLPNDCACLGLAIVLDACTSTSSCSPANLQYKWYVDGILQTNTNCSFSHIPIVAGNTYKVEILDLVTGCTGSAERTIKPCNKNN